MSPKSGHYVEGLAVHYLPHTSSVFESNNISATKIMVLLQPH